MIYSHFYSILHSNRLIICASSVLPLLAFFHPSTSPHFSVTLHPPPPPPTPRLSAILSVNDRPRVQGWLSECQTILSNIMFITHCVPRCRGLTQTEGVPFRGDTPQWAGRQCWLAGRGPDFRLFHSFFKCTFVTLCRPMCAGVCFGLLFKVLGHGGVLRLQVMWPKQEQ